MPLNKTSQNADMMMSEINITPLVDVMLVLLVIFIITAPLLVPQSIKVTLPSTEALAQQIQTNSAHLELTAAGQISMDGQTMSLTQLGMVLRERSTRPNFQLQVMADEKVAYGVVAKVMAVAQSNGANKLSFVTLPQK